FSHSRQCHLGCRRHGDRREAKRIRARGSDVRTRQASGGMIMEHRNLGNDLRVSALGLGCMPMAGGGVNMYGEADETESLATIHGAGELGVSFCDTAEIYGSLRNEELLGRWVRGQRDGLVMAIKLGFRFENGVSGGTDSSPANVRRGGEGS